MRALQVSKRFKKEFASFAKTHPSMVETWERFLKLRLASDANEEPFNKKDYQFSGGDLRGFWHVHLVFGKVILIYDYDDSDLYVFRVVDHSAIDGMSRRAQALRQTLTRDDMEPMDVGGTQDTPGLTAADRERIEALIYYMTAEDRDILEALIRGNYEDFLMFALEEVSEEAVMASLGEIKQMAATALSQTKLREGSMRAFMNITGGLSFPEDDESYSEAKTRRVIL